MTTTTFDLFSLMAISRKEMLAQGGTFIEVLNQEEDGVSYIPVSRAMQVVETISSQPQGEQQ